MIAADRPPASGQSDKGAVQASPRGAPCVTDLVIRAVRLHGQRVAVVVDGKAFTYAELDRLSDSVAGFLSIHGVRRAMAVGLLLANSVEFVVADLAVLKLGATLVPLSDMTTPAEAAHCLGLVQARALICNGRFAAPELADLAV